MLIVNVREEDKVKEVLSLFLPNLSGSAHVCIAFGSSRHIVSDLLCSWCLITVICAECQH